MTLSKTIYTSNCRAAQYGHSMQKRDSLMTAKKTRNCAIAVFCTLACSASAAEDRKSVYLFGVRASMAGYTPPPGFYASSFTFLYSGRESNDTLRLKANAALEVLSLLWVSDTKVLGGAFGFGLYAPMGYQRVTAGVNPSGTRPGVWNFVSNDTKAIGDPLPLAFIAWQSGQFHYKLSGMVNVPIGDYSKTRIANIGLNRWAGDITGSVTWLDPASKLEISLSPGVTFNGVNHATNYRTGTEFHVEAAVMYHASASFSAGLAGYHYKQLTGDSGVGATQGALKGQVSAIGPNLTYNFQVGQRPVYASARWMREFNAKNRLQGDVGYLTLTVPLGALPSR